MLASNQINLHHIYDRRVTRKQDSTSFPQHSPANVSEQDSTNFSGNMICGILVFSMFAASAFCTPIAQAKAPLKTITAPSAAPGSDSGGTSNDADLVSLLLSSPTALHRLSLLPDDLDFVFDFNNPPENATTSGKGESHRTRLKSFCVK